MNKLLSILFFTSLLLIACNKNESELENEVAVESVEELDAIMENCRNNEFETREEIENNLIGEWRLVGIRAGWIDDFTLGNITLNIDENKIVLNDLETGEVSETDWNLKFFEVNTYQFYYLETDEDVFNNRIGMETFCSDYMFGSGRVDDGSTYVYAKVR